MDKPDIPGTVGGLMPAIEQLIASVHDPEVSYGPNEDPYGKCVEVMWRAAYIAHEVVARELGVTGFQHGMSSLMLLGALRGMEGPFMVLDGANALYPQYDLLGSAQEWLERPSTREWFADEAEKRLAEFEAKPVRVWDDEDGHHERPAVSGHVVEHWRRLVANRPTKAEVED